MTTYLHELAHFVGTKQHGTDWKSGEELNSESGEFVEKQVFGGKIMHYSKTKYDV